MFFNLADNVNSRVGVACYITVYIALLAINQCYASLPGSIRAVPIAREASVSRLNDRLQETYGIGQSRNQVISRMGILRLLATGKYSIHRKHQRRDVSEKVSESSGDSLRRILNITSVLTSDNNTLIFNLSRANTRILLSKVARVEVVARFHSNWESHRLRKHSISMTLLLLSTSKIVRRGKMHVDEAAGAAEFTLDVTGMLRPPYAPNDTEKISVSLLSDVEFPNVTLSAVCKRRRKIKSCRKYGIVLESKPTLVIHYNN